MCIASSLEQLGSAWSQDTAGGLRLSLDKQPGAGGANWIQLFGDGRGTVLIFPDPIFPTLQKLGAKLDKWTLDKAGPDEAAVVDFRLWMAGPVAGQTAVSRPATQW